MQMYFHRTHFDPKPNRNPLIRKSLRNEPSYFHFPFGQSLIAESDSGPLIFFIYKQSAHPSF
jgi:hypothetical protein